MEFLYNLFYYIVPFLITLSVVVFVHELGHFWVAKRSGVKVEVFSIGFGKELFGFQDKSGTRWKISLIPLGGYVKMFGDKSAASNSDEELISSLSEEEKQVAFACKNLAIKSAIVVAGPMANYIFSILVFALFFMFFGTSDALPKITELLPNGPAHQASIEKNDIIIAMDGQEVKLFSDIIKIMALNNGEQIKLSIKRGDEILTKKITPALIVSKDVLGNEVKSYKLGVIADNIVPRKLGFLSSIGMAASECYNLSVMSLKALGQIITGTRSAKELGGPIKIAQYSAKSAEHGFLHLIWFMALLSVNLGVINLLPIPILDGGHLLIYAVEFMCGKKIASKIQNFGFQIGIILLIMLTMYTTFNDLSGLNFFKGK